MLAAPKGLIGKPALIPFVPRPVMLEAHSTGAAQKEDQNKRKGKEMENEEKKRTKKKKTKTKSSEALEDGSGAPGNLTMDRANGSGLSQKGQAREILLSSIAAFLKSSGFAKTLSVFRSEAQIETDGWPESFLNLEDLFCKFLEPSKGHADAIFDWSKDKDLEQGGICRKDECGSVHDASDHIHKKKRKQRNETGDETKAEINEHQLENGSIKCLNNVEKKTEDLSSLTNKSTLSTESNAKHKGEKKKKTKESSVCLAGNVEQLKVEETLETLEVITKKPKKRKRDKSTSENPDDVGSRQFQETSHDGRKERAEEDLEKSDLGKENVVASDENVDNIGKRSHKKRKRSGSEDRRSQAENETMVEESKHVYLEGADDTKETETIQMADKSLPDSEYPTLGKKRKSEKNKENSNEASKASPSELTPIAQVSLKESEGHRLANGNLQKKEGGASSKAKEKEKLSAEHTIKAFQRVKIDEVKFADDRLQDNSYWALDGEGSGYGAKAQEVLGQVRGRDFRHEKTKKKRGTYRGGQIDLQSHSIKFNYSDED